MPIGAKRVILAGRAAWSFHGASLDMDFAHARAAVGGHPNSITSLITFANSTGGTNLRPTSASGATFSTFAANVPRITPGTGILLENAATNNLLNSQAPATQTTASLGTGSYTLWVNGSGSALASGGTATITGAASATNGAPNTFTVTVAGTVTVTVTGSLNAFQLEAGAFGTSLIITAAATVTRSADNAQLNGAALTAALAAKGFYFQTSGVSGVVTTGRFISYGGNSFGGFLSSTQVLASDSTNNATATIGNSNTFASTVKSALACDNTSMISVASGGTAVTQATSTFTTGQTGAVFLGNNSSLARGLNGYIARASFSPVKGFFNYLATFP